MSTETVSNIQNPYRLIPRFLTLYKNTFLQFFFLSWVGKYGEWISPNCGKKGGAGQNTFQSLYSYSRHSSSIVYPLTNIMTTVSLHLESSMLNIASNPCFALNVLLPLLSSPLLSSPLLSSPSSRPSQPLLDRSIPDFNTFSSVEDWLAAIKMSQYRDNFLNSGFTSLQLVAQMTSEWVHLLMRKTTTSKKTPYGTRWPHLYEMTQRRVCVF